MSEAAGPEAALSEADLPTAWRWSTPIRLIRLEGADARRFLHGQSSQAIELAPPGSCVATCLISPTARMRALALACIDEGGIDLLVVAGDGGQVHQQIDRVLFPADRVRLGRPQPATLVRWLGATPEALEASGTTRLLHPGVDLGAGRDQPALLLVGEEAPGVSSQADIHGYPAQENRPPLPAWLQPLPELTPEQRERRRLRQGFPAAPGELNDDTNPFELGLANWVSLSKGCYVGQETLAKLATYDGVKQQLRHWRAPRTGPAAADACAPGTPLITTAGGRAGVITSMLSSPDGLEGLALVRRAALEDHQLLAGESTAGAVRLEIQIPNGFSAPPVGAGGGGKPS
ncbi:MAG: YgfZ/GcvT domain-containing protein [Vulcanococcus sp.]